MKSIAFLLLSVSALFAAGFPADTPLTYAAMPAGVPMPAYLEPYADPVLGTQVTRVADQTAMGSSQPVLGHHYAKDQPWNADGSLISLSGWPSAILDGQTYRFLRWIMPPGEHHTWANTEPDIIYGIQQPNSFVKVDAGSGSATVLRVFGEYTEVSYGAYEGNISNDDRYIAFQCRAAGTNYAVVYDIRADSVVARMAIGSLWPNNVTMSQSGDYVAVQWDVQGDGPRQGIDIFTRQLAHVWKVGTCGGCHYDLGYDTEGNEAAVMTDIDNGSRAIVAVRLDTGARTTLLRDDQMSWYIHVSCRNLERPGWAYLTEFADPNTQVSKANYQLVFAVRIDGSGTVERFAHVHHSATVAYDRSPFGVPNRDGTRMMFRSDWEDGSGPVYSYVAEMPRAAHDGSTGVLESAGPQPVARMSLEQNCPNPFNGSTRIDYALPRPGEVSLEIYNLAGQRVSTLAEGMRAAGLHAVRWDGRSAAGDRLASGVYLCRLQAGARVVTRKLLACQ